MATIKETTSAQKPSLLFKLEGFDGDINDALFVNGKDAIITGAEDRSLKVWIKRDSGKFWPSVCEMLPSPVSYLCYRPEVKKLFVGLDNGTVSEYILSDDSNSLRHTRDYLAHIGRVTGVICGLDMEWLISTSKDKTVAWHHTETGAQLGVYELEFPGTSLEYDSGSKYVFAGDASGRITLLSLQAGGECRVVRDLRGHSEAVTCLSWDSVASRLLSSGSDCVVILWDIGGGKGAAFELQGHYKAVTSVAWWMRGASSGSYLPPGVGTAASGNAAAGSLSNGDAAAASQGATAIGGGSPGVVVSAGLDCGLLFWPMRGVTRQETPTWSQADVCEQCAAPFFWNIRKMWNDLAVGVRQHHCRRCGKAVCEKCSPHLSTFPIMGFEKEVRICSRCYPLIKKSDRESLVIPFNARHPVSRICIDEALSLLLTVGKDRVVKIWDIKALS